MPEQTWTEVPVFIHGITPGEDPGSHDGDYKTLLDLFYYVSSDGERGVRNHVFEQIARAVNQLPHGQDLSLTLFTHSAGTVIAHDFLYHLFGAAASPLAAVSAQKEVLAVRDLVDAGSLRVRKLFTMGSPITPLVFRADSLLLKVVLGQKIDPAGLGLKPDPELGAPRWVNFWDRDDVISFPLAFNYAAVQNQAVVEDFYADIGDFFPAVHGKYWSSTKVAARMAEVW